MPLALILLGVLFLTAAVRGDKCNGQQCSDLLFKTLKDDFTGPDNFIYWGIALFIIGAAGYYKPLKPLSNAFLGLVILVLFISNRGFFQKFMEQISETQHATTNADLIGGLFGGSNANDGLLHKYQKALPDSGVSIITKLFGL
jgi:hypothetical protein